MATIIAAFVGLMLGSFLSVLLFRWPHWNGVAGGRSRCAACLRVLAWHDLIPLVSWLRLRGACRYCHSRISVWHPLLELALAGVFGLYVYRFGIISIWSIFDLAVIFGLLALFFFDLKHGVLPDIIIWPLIALGIVRLIGGQAMLHDTLLAALILVGFFGALYVISRGRWLGFGDVKLALAMGLLFGYPLAVRISVAAIWAGALIGMSLIAFGKATRKTALPFGSFWTAAALCAMMIG